MITIREQLEAELYEANKKIDKLQKDNDKLNKMYKLLHHFRNEVSLCVECPMYFECSHLAEDCEKNINKYIEKEVENDISKRRP